MSVTHVKPSLLYALEKVPYSLNGAFLKIICIVHNRHIISKQALPSDLSSYFKLFLIMLRSNFVHYAK